jgi:hypothetical protein
MEKIIFDNDICIWKTKLNLSESKGEILELCEDVVKNNSDGVNFDAYSYSKIKDDVNFLGNIVIKNKLDEIGQISINNCKKIHNDRGIDFNMIETDAWVNIVRSDNPVQLNFKEGHEKYHIHTELNKTNNSFVPSYTYVYYIQMPDRIEGEDAVLYFKSKSGKEYSILPEEDDLIIMEADVPHAPNNAPNSTIDRIVFAGNVGLSYVKKEKSLI